MHRIDPHIVESVLAEVLARTGLDFTGSNPGLAERRINMRISETKSANPEEYCKLLYDSAEEWGQIASLLTINHSLFFRDPLHCYYLSQYILPEIVRTSSAESGSSCRIWSAGCSSGEEPYSISILLKELAKKEKIEIDSQIFATDIDTESIARASVDYYNSEKIENAPFGIIQKYFSQKGEEFCLDPEIKKMVKFSLFDLLDHKSYAPPDSIFGNFDMVLCRNVLIYFDRKYQKIIFNKLYRSLKPNGYLSLGESEIPVEGFRNKFKRVNECCKIYKKIS